MCRSGGMWNQSRPISTLIQRPRKSNNNSMCFCSPGQLIGCYVIIRSFPDSQIKEASVESNGNTTMKHKLQVQVTAMTHFKELYCHLSGLKKTKTILRYAVSWLRRLVAGFPPRRPEFEPGSGHVGFVVKMALGQVFSEYFSFPCQSSFRQLRHNHHHLSSGAGTIGKRVATVPSGQSHSTKNKINPPIGSPAEIRS
jgi:hypothetical protein